MQRKHNASLLENAHALRREMTPEERRLWFGFLRGYPVRFARQKILGRYIVDFYCARAKLAVELDASQHYTDEARRYDAERASFLESYGLTVMRVPNQELQRNFEGVCETIDHFVREALGEDMPRQDFRRE